jgi:hypothetical protein
MDLSGISNGRIPGKYVPNSPTDSRGNNYMPNIDQNGNITGYSPSQFTSGNQTAEDYRKQWIKDHPGQSNAPVMRAWQAPPGSLSAAAGLNNIGANSPPAGSTPAGATPPAGSPPSAAAPSAPASVGAFISGAVGSVIAWVSGGSSAAHPPASTPAPGTQPAASPPPAAPKV